MSKAKSSSLNNFFLMIEESYSNIFKAGVALTLVGLIGLSQVFPKLIENDHKAKELIFQVESHENILIEDINKIDCRTLKASTSKCRFAKYLTKSNSVSNKLAGNIVGPSLFLGAILILFSAICLLFYKLTRKTPEPDITIKTTG